MAEETKPLPAVPQTPPLSADGRKHRRKVIQAFLGLLNDYDDVKEDAEWEDLGEKDAGPVGQIEQALDAAADLQHVLPDGVPPELVLYVQHSLVLEEAFLRDVGVPMAYLRPKLLERPSAANSGFSNTGDSSKRQSVASSIFNFFAPKRHSRAYSTAKSSSIRDSWASRERSSFDGSEAASSSIGSYMRSRRFSLLPYREVKTKEPEPFPISTSPGVQFPSSAHASSPSDFIRHQAISVLIDASDMQVMHYYTESDISLVATLRSLGQDRQWVHSGARITATVSVPAPADTASSSSSTASTSNTSTVSLLAIETPQDEDIINEQSRRLLTSAISFGKFLELVVYSPRLKTYLDKHPHALNFTIGARKISLSVEDMPVFIFRTPRVQPQSQAASSDGRALAADEAKHLLRRQQRSYWEAVNARLDRLEDMLGSALHKKRLPRLPSEWIDEPEDISLSPSPAQSVASSVGISYAEIATLRENCLSQERVLNTKLARCDNTDLNDNRRAFLASAREFDEALCQMENDAADKEAAARAKKGRKGSDGVADDSKSKRTSEGSERDATIKGKEALGPGASDTVKGVELVSFPTESKEEKTSVPLWWSTNCHVPPSGNVIVREDDWGSIIAFTMSTPDYHASLSKTSETAEPLITPALSFSRSTGSGFFSAFRAPGMGSMLSLPTTASTSSLPSTTKCYNDDFSAVVSRKENPTGMLDAIKDRSSKFGSLRFGRGAASTSPSRREIAASDSSAPPSSWSRLLGSTDAGSSRAEIGSVHSTDSAVPASEAGTDDTVAPELPPKDFVGGRPVPPSKSTLRSTLDRWLFANAAAAESMQDPRPHVKYDFTVAQRPFPSSCPGPNPAQPPQPRRLKFSCTVYYASVFANLRAKCGIQHDEYVQSLSQIVPFKAEGGKSSSGFWRTADGRWLVKSLVSKWGVADLAVLIGMGGSYFDWMLQEGKGEGGMVKLVGFYTVEVRNLDTGTGEKVDVVVMENLFWDRHVARTYDLKGIQTRKVKRKEGKEKEKEKDAPGGVLFDAEWLQHERKRTLVTPQSKAELMAALEADAAWLAHSNIMDYSLLLGIDEERREVVGGIVDTIGSYTFAKTLEYNLKSGAARKPEEVTVVPPAEYQERFVNSMKKYFLECPDMTVLPEVEGIPVWRFPQEVGQP
ncbi:hypothetical protein CYLTODRAFT_487452 [Cylindrobasidium torrendii FP15055 ss-10]|uniref:PIPK domain-containing protein n=1 Tax=Cylindrobasidium torrendii FP15055 ss-10 TaxID=1314674 RepID=A0A0D7BLB9_9AGAR|nr:hypothetical protein CYLTODRAFT_487452 [Cylindrobasidium torrendii FP15055 ss-10]